MLDYSKVAEFESSLGDGHVQKYCLGPIALFEMPEDEETRNRESLQTLCIQCTPWTKSSGADPPPVFTSRDNLKWKIAKAIVNAADAQYHQTVVHLAYTHLVVEAFLVGTYRTLPHNHPIFVLLKPHFEGTANINNMATNGLMSPGGIVDQLAPQEIHSLNSFVGQELLSVLETDLTFPAMLKARRMDKHSFKAPYPYRDDGMLIWVILKEWVSGYLNIYYKGDSNRIAEDSELQDWIMELKSDTGGKIKWLDSFDNTPV